MSISRDRSELVGALDHFINTEEGEKVLSMMGASIKDWMKKPNQTSQQSVWREVGGDLEILKREFWAPISPPDLKKLSNFILDIGHHIAMTLSGKKQQSGSGAELGMKEIEITMAGHLGLYKTDFAERMNQQQRGGKHPEPKRPRASHSSEESLTLAQKQRIPGLENSVLKHLTIAKQLRDIFRTLVEALVTPMLNKDRN
eukprot:sb/3470693/